MNAESLYRYLMGSVVLFFSGWLVLLLGAFTWAFRQSGNGLAADFNNHAD